MSGLSSLLVLKMRMGYPQIAESLALVHVPLSTAVCFLNGLRQLHVTLSTKARPPVRESVSDADQIVTDSGCCPSESSDSV